MKKQITLSILALILLVPPSFSQTKEIEMAAINKRFQNKEFDINEYKAMSVIWKELLEYYGGYPEFPLNPSTEMVEFEYVKVYSELTKKQIYDRIHEWAALTFGNINSVQHYENYDNGKVILKGTFTIIHREDYLKFWGGTAEGSTSRDCFQTYIFTIKENKVKLQVTDLKYEFKIYKNINGVYRYIDIKESLHTLYPITNSKKEEWKERLDIIYRTKKRLDLMISSLDNYIKSIDADYDF
jgi:hypothetical protein